MEFLRKYPAYLGVYGLSEVNGSFEEYYIRNRQNERRLHDDETVKILPILPTSHAHQSEWLRRSRSCMRLEKYIDGVDRPLNVLDVGCGNGWFSNRLAESERVQVLGIDINMVELVQARRVFPANNLYFAYGGVFDGKLPTQFFDLVILNSVIQYFPDLFQLLSTLKKMLSRTGEIHILDSPMYRDSEVEKAKERTLEYYQRMDTVEMTSYYFHHCWKELKEIPYRLLYDPRKLSNKLRSRFVNPDTPFPWICV